MRYVIPAILLIAAFSKSAHGGVYGCDANYLRGAYDKVHVETATKYAIYALLSNNTYTDVDDRPHFNVPEEWEKMGPTINDPSGLAFDVYERKRSGNLLEVVIAFRGTAGWKDWKNGDLSNREYEVTRRLVREVIDTYKEKSVPIVATGHSLGGGLAMFVSYQFPGVAAVGFNSSPRYHSKYHKESNKRVQIFESGDATRLLGNALFPWRWGAYAKKMDMYFQKYNFTNGNPVKNHFSLPLARGLLLLGSLESPELAELLKKNCDVVPR